MCFFPKSVESVSQPATIRSGRRGSGFVLCGNAILVALPHRCGGVKRAVAIRVPLCGCWADRYTHACPSAAHHVTAHLPIGGSGTPPSRPPGSYPVPRGLGHETDTRGQEQPSQATFLGQNRPAASPGAYTARCSVWKMGCRSQGLTAPQMAQCTVRVPRCKIPKYLVVGKVPTCATPARSTCEMLWHPSIASEPMVAVVPGCTTTCPTNKIKGEAGAEWPCCSSRVWIYTSKATGSAERDIHESSCPWINTMYIPSTAPTQLCFQTGAPPGPPCLSVARRLGRQDGWTALTEVNPFRLVPCSVPHPGPRPWQ